MFIHCELVILVLALSLDGRVHTGEIIKGKEAVAHSRPYMAIVERYMENGAIIYCGGFLLNEDFLMTAAHCSARSYSVYLGVHDFFQNENTQNISVKQAFPHKNYNSTTLENDIMILKLSSKAKFNNNVKPIALASRRDGSLPKSCSVAGWGMTRKDDEVMSDVLMEVNVTLIKSLVCTKENFYCSEGAGPGKGDSGSPLVCEDGKAYGVVSFSTNNFSFHGYAKTSDYGT